MSDTLTLKASGTNGCEPDPNPWKPAKGAAVTIENTSGYEQVLSDISSGLLAPASGGSITVPTTGWSGHVGSAKGTYTYNDGSDKRGVRTGTIDPT